MNTNRREFLKRTAATGALAALPLGWGIQRASAKGNGARARIAAIGVGGSRGAYSQGSWIAKRAAQFGDVVAVCDCDELHMAEFNEHFGGRLKKYADYRDLLEREKPDVVTIGTPDHWHVPIAIAAMHAGADVYCEKPLTLTIEEGFKIRDAVNKTGRVFQVGTQQRSEHNLLFLQAIAIIKSGRLGSNVNARVAIGGGTVGGPFPETTPPDGLNWDLWLGPAQPAGYSDERRKEFRWYFDYSGGKMTDWGAHHIDIAQWALGQDHSGPVSVRGTGQFTPLVPDNFDWIAYLEGKAQLPNGYHTPSQFSIDCEYSNGAVITVCDNYVGDDGRTQFPNGILFEGEDGRIFVNRERLTGKPVEEMTAADQQQLQESVVQIYHGKEPGDHMRNFFQCIESRDVPIADVETHHRTMTTCHLCNIALMLGRDLTWDPQKEQFVGDEQADHLVSRPRRKEYSWDSTT